MNSYLMMLPAYLMRPVVMPAIVCWTMLGVLALVILYAIWSIWYYEMGGRK